MYQSINFCSIFVKKVIQYLRTVQKSLSKHVVTFLQFFGKNWKKRGFDSILFMFLLSGIHIIGIDKGNEFCLMKGNIKSIRRKI